MKTCPHPGIQAAVNHVGGQAALAARIGVKQQQVWTWLHAERPVPIERCVAIERATAAAVTCEHLSPGLAWVRVPDPCWPHPGGRPCLDVAAPARVAA